MLGLGHYRNSIVINAGPETKYIIFWPHMTQKHETSTSCMADDADVWIYDFWSIDRRNRKNHGYLRVRWISLSIIGPTVLLGVPPILKQTLEESHVSISGNQQKLQWWRHMIRREPKPFVNFTLIGWSEKETATDWFINEKPLCVTSYVNISNQCIVVSLSRRGSS